MHASIAQQVVEHLLHQGKIEEEGRRSGTTVRRGSRPANCIRHRRASRLGRRHGSCLAHRWQLQLQTTTARGDNPGYMAVQLLTQIIKRKRLAFDRTVLQLGEAAHRSRISLKSRDLSRKRVERSYIQRVPATQTHLSHLHRPLEHGDGRAQVMRERRIEAPPRFGRAPQFALSLEQRCAHVLERLRQSPQLATANGANGKIQVLLGDAVGRAGELGKRPGNVHAVEMAERQPAQAAISEDRCGRDQQT